MPYINLAGSLAGEIGKVAGAATAGDNQYQALLTRQINTNKIVNQRTRRDALAVMRSQRIATVKSMERHAEGMTDLLSRLDEGSATMEGYRLLRQDLFDLDEPTARQIDAMYGMIESTADPRFPFAMGGMMDAKAGLIERRDEVKRGQIEDRFADQARAMDATPEEITEASAIRASDLTPDEMRGEFTELLSKIAESRIDEQTAEYTKGEARRLMAEAGDAMHSDTARELAAKLMSGGSSNPATDLARLRVVSTDGPDVLQALERDSMNIGIIQGYRSGIEAARAQLGNQSSTFSGLFEGDLIRDPAGEPPRQLNPWADQAQKDQTAEQYYGNPEGASYSDYYGTEPLEPGEATFDKGTIAHDRVVDTPDSGIAAMLDRWAKDNGIDLTSAHGRWRAQRYLEELGITDSGIYRDMWERKRVLQEARKGKPARLEEEEARRAPPPVSPGLSGVSTMEQMT